MDLSIVIVSWNTKELLEKCLSSIERYPPKGDFEVFLVDNVSSDGSVEMVREKFPRVRLIVNSKNVGFAHGNNQAIRESSGEYVMLLNPDTEVKPGLFETLLDFMRSHPKAGADGPRLLSPDGSMQNSCSPSLTLPRELWRLFHLDVIFPYGQYRMESWDLTKPRKVDGLQGACLLLRKRALDQVGLLDEDYFMYTEELDLCYRLRKAGWSLYFIPEAAILHYGGQSTSQVAESMFIRLYESRLLYFRKNQGRLAAAGYKGILLAAAIARLGFSPLSYLIFPEQRQRNKTLAGHYSRLISVLPKM